MSSSRMTIETYQVANSLRQDGSRKRGLHLHPSSNEGDPVSRVLMNFAMESQESINIGYYDSKSKIIVVNPPLADFDSMYHVVQTERPVFFHWEADDEKEPQRLLWFSLGTDEEPTGEGLKEK